MELKKTTKLHEALSDEDRLHYVEYMFAIAKLQYEEAIKQAEKNSNS